MKTFNHSIYTKIISWYLLLNGLLGLLFVALEVPPFLNEFVFTLNAIVFPCIAALLGYYLLIREFWVLKILPTYLLLSIPILAIGSWEYSHAHAMSLHFRINLFGLVIGLNALPIIWFWLFTKHINLTSHISESRTATTE